MEPAWGWEYDAKRRLEEVIVFQGVKRLRFVEWTNPERDPKDEEMETLEKMANEFFWG